MEIEEQTGQSACLVFFNQPVDERDERLAGSCKNELALCRIAFELEASGQRGDPESGAPER